MSFDNSHGGNVYHDRIRLDYSVNLNPLGIPDAVYEAVKNSTRLIGQYPDPDLTELRARLSELYGLEGSRFIFGNGAAELIDSYIASAAPKRVLLPEPSFSEYRRALEVRGCEIIPWTMPESEGFALTTAILQKLGEQPDLIMICNPNNPTGRLIDPSLLAELLKQCRTRQIHVFLDECFILLSAHPEYAATADMIRSFPNLFILRSFTKTFAMPGLRLGYGVSSDQNLLKKMYRQVQPWNVSVTASEAGLAALDAPDHAEKARGLICRERLYLCGILAEAGFQVYDGDANYILFRGPETLYTQLLNSGVMIRDCSNYRGLAPGFYRIAVRTHEDNVQFAEILQALLSSFTPGV